MNKYDFSDLKEGMLYPDEPISGDYFYVTMWADKSPYVGDIVTIEGEDYEVTSVQDDTEDEEYELGLRYDKVYFSKI